MVCANCGAPHDGRLAVCAQCGQPLSPPRSARPTSATARAATASHIALAVSLDVLVCLLILLMVAFVGGPGWAIVAVLGFLGVTGWFLLRRGRTLGLTVTGGRVVVASTASAPGTRFSGWRVADTRRGQDPLHLRYAPPSLFPAPPAASPLRPAVSASAPQPLRRRDVASESAFSASHPPPAVSPPPGVRAAAFVLVVDDGARVAVASAMVVGRDPVVADGTLAVAVPDLARELSKAHFRVDRDCAGAFTVTDLSSTNGTILNGVDMTPHQPYPFGVNDVVEAGRHGFRVEPRVRIEAGAAA